MSYVKINYSTSTNFSPLKHNCKLIISNKTQPKLHISHAIP